MSQTDRRIKERRSCTVEIRKNELRDGRDRRIGICNSWSQGSLIWEQKNRKEKEK